MNLIMFFSWDLSAIKKTRTHTHTIPKNDPFFLPLYAHGQIDIIIVV